MAVMHTTEAPAHEPIGPRIADLVRESGLKQAYIARRLNLSRSAVSDRLRGRTRWSADELAPLAHVLHLRLVDLLGDDQEAGLSNNPPTALRKIKGQPR